MKRKGLIIFLPVFLALTSFSWAHPFQVGEKLVYTIKLIGLPVGTQTLQVKKIIQSEDPLYLLTSEVKGSELLSLVYHLEDRIESYVDVKTLYPRLIKMNLREGSLEREMEIEINWEENKKAIIWDKKKDKKRLEELTSPPLDLLSLLYWIRTQNLKIGSEFKILLVDSTTKFKKVHFRVSALEKVYTYKGIFPALVCEEIALSDGIRVWFSLDERHLPLQIQVTTPLGFLTAILKEVS
jgi:hypothetical protein